MRLKFSLFFFFNDIYRTVIFDMSELLTLMTIHYRIDIIVTLGFVLLIRKIYGLVEEVCLLCTIITKYG